MTGDPEMAVTRVERALVIAARVVAYQGEKYSPIFERIEHELDMMTRPTSTVDRALLIARAHEGQTLKSLPAR
jgi:hypothetical protein